MKIIFVTPYADPEKGAAIVRVNSYRDYFTAAGHTVTILAPARKGIEPQENIIRYNGAKDLLKRLGKEDFDILVGTSPPIQHVFVATLFCKLRGIPVVLDSKDIFSHTAPKVGLIKEGSPKHRVYNILERVTHHLVDKILVLDADLGDWIHENYHIPRNKILVAANGVDTDTIYKDPQAGKAIRKKLKIPATTPVIIYLGGLGDERYIDFLTHTANTIKKRKAVVLFVIAFDGSPHAIRHMEQIDETVKKLDMQDSFRVVKNIPHADVYQYLSAADIGVDFWGNLVFLAVTVKILEYLACGLPVIVKTPSRNKTYERFFTNPIVGHGSSEWGDYTKHLDETLSHIKQSRKIAQERTNMIKKFHTRKATNTLVLDVLNDLTSSK